MKKRIFGLILLVVMILNLNVVAFAGGGGGGVSGNGPLISSTSIQLPVECPDDLPSTK